MLFIFSSGKSQKKFFAFDQCKCAPRIIFVGPKVKHTPKAGFTLTEGESENTESQFTIAFASGQCECIVRGKHLSGNEFQVKINVLTKNKQLNYYGA